MRRTTRTTRQRPSRQRIYPAEDHIVGIKDAAEYIGVDVSTIRRWLTTNPKTIPHYRTPGGHRRFKLSDLDQFMRSSE